jgi:hypothetical protein
MGENNDPQTSFTLIAANRPFTRVVCMRVNENFLQSIVAPEENPYDVVREDGE